MMNRNSCSQQWWRDPSKEFARPRLGRWSWMRVVLLSCGLIGGFSSAEIRAAEPASSDLDVLLRLLGQGGVVHNERLYVNNARMYDQTGEKWIQAVDHLSGSRTGEVAEAVKRLKPAIALLHQAREVEAKRSKALVAGRKDSALQGIDLVDAQVELLHGPDEFQLDEMVRNRMITREEANTRLQQRNQIKNDLIRRFSEDFANNYISGLLMERQTHQLRNRAAVLKNDVVREVLLPTVRARAGNEQKPPPVQIKLALFPNSNTQPSSSDVRISIRSRSPQELTRLTVMLEFQTTEGSRFAALYIPKLAPSGGGWFDPIALSAVFLNNPPKDVLPIGPKMNGARYSVLCDQFRAEDLEPTTITREEMTQERRLLAMLPGTVYASLGIALQRSVPEMLKAPGKQEREPDRRYEIAFKKLTPIKQDYQLEFELVDHQTDKAKLQPQQFRGELTLPEVTFDNFGHMISTDEVVLKVRSGSQDMQLTLREDHDGKSQWFGFRRFVSESDIPAADSPDGIAKARLFAAMKLAVDGKFEDARAAYDQISADYPGTTWEMQAKLGASKLKDIKEGRAKVDALRKAKEEHEKKPGNLTGPMRSPESVRRAAEAVEKKTGLSTGRLPPNSNPQPPAERPLGPTRLPPTSETNPAGDSTATPNRKLTSQERQAQAIYQAGQEQQALISLDLAKKAIAVKQQDLARSHLQQVIDLSPNSKAASTARKLLKNLDQ